MGEYQRKRAARAAGIRSCDPISKAVLYGLGSDGMRLPTGPTITPLKGQRDGNCNRTACQAPLAGRPQWTMPDYRGGFYHYCEVCENLFSTHDRRMGTPLRCTPITETGAS